MSGEAEEKKKPMAPREAAKAKDTIVRARYCYVQKPTQTKEQSNASLPVKTRLARFRLFIRYLESFGASYVNNFPKLSSWFCSMRAIFPFARTMVKNGLARSCNAYEPSFIKSF